MSDRKISELQSANLQEHKDYHVLGARDGENYKVNISDVIDEAKKAIVVPTKMSELANDVGYIDIIPGEYITESELNEREYATIDDLSEYVKKDDEIEIPEVPTKVSQLDNDVNFADKKYVDDAINNIDIPDIPDLNDYAKKSDIPTVPTNLGAFINDKGYISIIPDEYITESKLNSKGYISNIPSEYITETELDNKGYVNESYVIDAISNAQLNGGNGTNIDLSIYAKKTDIPTVPSRLSQLSNDAGYLNSIPGEYITESELEIKLKDYALNDDGGSSVSVVNENIVSNGRFLDSDVNQTEFFPWRFWGCAEVDKERAIDSRGLLCIKFTRTQQECEEFGQDTIGGGIHQEVHGLPRNEKVTLSFRHLHASNVHTTKADIIFRKKGGIEVHEINFSLNQENAVVHTETFTFTTPDIDFDYATIGFFTDEGKVVATDTNNVCSFGDVKLEVGTQVTEWVENKSFKETGHSNLNYAFNYCGAKMQSGWYSSNSKGVPGQEGYIKACTINITDTHRDIPLIIECLQRNTVNKKTLTIKFARNVGADPDLEFFTISGSSDVGDAFLHKADISKWDLYIKKTEAFDEITFWHCKTLYDMHGLFVDWTPNQQVDAYFLPEETFKPTLWGGSTVGIDGGIEVGRYIDFHHTNRPTNDYSARILAGDGDLSMAANVLPCTDNYYTLGKPEYKWNTLYSVSAPNVSSDRTIKENINYIRNEEDIITYNDCYNFVKDDLELTTYNIIGDEKQHINFIAQDLLVNEDGTDNKVGQMIVKPEEAVQNESTLSYDQGNYISVLAGALKEALNKIEQLEAEIKELKDK